MEDILKAILQGAAHSQQAARRQQAAPQADPIADLIGGILGAGSSQKPQTVPGIQDLIGSILGGATQQRQAPQQQPNGLGMDDILGAILGASQRRGTTQSGGLADLIGMVLGGGNQQRGFGGQQINPIAQILSQKLGIPPQIAQMAVAYFISHFLSKKIDQMRQPQQPQPSNDGYQDEYGIGRAKPTPDNYDLDDLLDISKDEEALKENLEGNGMLEDLARVTGLDKTTAGQTINELLKIIRGERKQVRPVQPSRSRQQEDNLEDLLDTW